MTQKKDPRRSRKDKRQPDRSHTTAESRSFWAALTSRWKRLRAPTGRTSGAPQSKQATDSPPSVGFFTRAFKYIGASLTIFVALVIATVLFSDVFQPSTVRIEPFTTNSALQGKGFDQDGLARLIAHKISVMIKEARSIKRSQGIDVPPSMNLPDVEVPGAKLSAKSLLRYLQEFGPLRYVRRKFGLNTVKVNGEAWLAANKVQIDLRLTDVNSGKLLDARTFVDDFDKIDSLTTKTSETILADVEPYLCASYFYQNKRTNEALAQIILCIHQDSPDQPHLALTLWGKILIDQKKYDEAIAKLEEATKYETSAKQKQEFVAAYNNWGLALLSQHKVDEAIVKFQEAINHDPTYAHAFNNYGMALLKKKETDKAIEKLERAVKLDPDLAIAFYNLAYARSKTKPDDAIALYRRALEIDPDFVEAYCGLALILANGSEPQLEEAITLLNKALKKDANSAAAHNNLGLAWMNKEDNLHAKSEFEKAIAVYARQMGEKGNDQDFVDAYSRAENNLGSIYEDEKKFDVAVGHYDAAIKIRPDYYFAYVGKGDALRKWARFDEALTAYETVIEKSEPESQSRILAYAGKGMVLVQRCSKCKEAMKAKDLEQAISMFNESLKIRYDADVAEQLEAARNTLDKITKKRD